MTSNLDTSYQFDKIYIEKYDKSTDVLMIARNLFDLREYKKCAYLLKDFISNSEYQPAIFLYYYSLFLAG
jgi:anaphase-promoting complex subunit 8